MFNLARAIPARTPFSRCLLSSLPVASPSRQLRLVHRRSGETSRTEDVAREPGDSDQYSKPQESKRTGPWNPTKKLTFAAMAALKEMHSTDPDTFTLEKLGMMYGISREAVKRVLRSKFREKHSSTALDTTEDAPSELPLSNSKFERRPRPKRQDGGAPDQTDLPSVADRKRWVRVPGQRPNSYEREERVLGQRPNSYEREERVHGQRRPNSSGREDTRIPRMESRPRESYPPATREGQRKANAFGFKNSLGREDTRIPGNMDTRARESYPPATREGQRKANAFGFKRD